MADGGSDRDRSGLEAGVAGAGALNLLKLCVGAETAADLEAWQRSRAAARRRRGAVACPVHVTRMWPRREGELLSGGSLFWVIRGMITLRQRILALEEAFDGEGGRRCAIVLDPELVRIEPRPCRPFQGWRYLTGADAPADLAGDGAPAAADELPGELDAALRELGLRKR